MQWSASKRASIVSEIQKLASTNLKNKLGAGGGSGRRPPDGSSGGGGNEPPKRVAANDNTVKILGRGSTGRTDPKNTTERNAMQRAMSRPTAGMVITMKEPMKDPRWPAKDGWVKMRQNIQGVEIHYVWNPRTREADDFKFKN
jgi:filamentous hemagglutinin